METVSTKLAITVSRNIYKYALFQPNGMREYDYGAFSLYNVLHAWCHTGIAGASLDVSSYYKARSVT